MTLHNLFLIVAVTQRSFPVPRHKLSDNKYILVTYWFLTHVVFKSKHLDRMHQEKIACLDIIIYFLFSYIIKYSYMVDIDMVFVNIRESRQQWTIISFVIKNKSFSPYMKTLQNFWVTCCCWCEQRQASTSSVSLYLAVWAWHATPLPPAGAPEKN